jgi:hypothetical protein
MSSPRVDIYVGEEKKHFNLPKDILCYYSSFFDRCFNGGFNEAKNQKLHLPEDDPEFERILVDYMFAAGGNPIRLEGSSGEQMGTCLAFIEYAGKYDLPGAVEAVSGDFKRPLEEEYELYGLLYSLIEIIFRVLPKNHVLRALVARFAVLGGLITGHHSEEEEEEEVDGFAAEVLKTIQRKQIQGRRY